MNRYEIEEKMSSIFMKRFSMSFLSNPEMKEMKLLGKSGIPARELLHVYFDVKRDFGISIPEEDVAEGRFDTYTHIVDIIAKQLAGCYVVTVCQCANLTNRLCSFDKSTCIIHRNRLRMFLWS